MKVKTLLPILGLTSVAVAAPVITSCAQAPKEKEKVVLDRWTTGHGWYTARTKDYIDINTVTQYTFSVNWLRFPPIFIMSCNSINFTLDHPSTEFDEDSIKIEINDVRYSEKDPSTEDVGYHFIKDGLTPVIRVFNYTAGFITNIKIKLTMKFKSPLKDVSPAITMYGI